MLHIANEKASDYHRSMDFDTPLPFYALVFSLLFLVAGNAHANGDIAAPNAQPTESIQSALDRETFLRITAGEMLMQQGDVDNGLPLLLKAAATHRDESLYIRSVDLCIQAKAGGHAIVATKAWLGAFPHSRDAALRLRQLQLTLGQTADLGSSLQRLLQLSEPQERISLIRAVPSALSHIAHTSQRVTIGSEGLRHMVQDAATQHWAVTTIAQLQYDAQQFQASLGHARTITMSHPEFQPAWFLVMLNMSKLNMEPRGLSVLTAKPNDNDKVVRAKGSALVQYLRLHQRNDEAYATMEGVRSRLPQDNDWAYQQAMLADQLQRFDDMERLLREVIAREPRNAHAINALGFSFAERNIRLDEALQLTQQAVALKPDNAQILDSLGWVQFKMGQLQAAEQTLAKAMHMQADPEIAAHWGEVLWVLNRKSEAQAAWKQGLELEPHHLVLLQTIQRLQQSAP